ncbi:MAG: hypothetical protein WCE64_13530 [Bacteroidales bacterium]
MRIKLSSFLLIAISLLFTSCDAEHVKDYTVINEYGNSVILNYKIGTSSIVEHNIIQPNDSLLIYHASYVYGTVGVSDDRDRLSIKDMSLNVNNKNILVDKNDWEYIQHGKYYADYYLNIDTSLIEQIK